MIGRGYTECIERGCSCHERKLTLSDGHEAAGQKAPGVTRVEPVEEIFGTLVFPASHLSNMGRRTSCVKTQL
jgi:hypothetical protein